MSIFAFDIPGDCGIMFLGCSRRLLFLKFVPSGILAQREPFAGTSSFWAFFVGRMMDTSKQLYAGHDLDMIRKAGEVRELWKPTKSDLFISEEEKEIDPRFNYVYWSEIERHKNKKPTFLICYDKHSIWISSTSVTWLPRQDQLWKIIPPKIKYIDFERDVKFKEGVGLRLYAKIPISSGITDHWNIGGFSVEQLLLKLFYKAEFNKTWNGKDWEQCPTH